MTTSRTIKAPDTATLRAALKAARPGDILLLNGSAYQGPFKLTTSNVSLLADPPGHQVIFEGSDELGQMDVLFINTARGCTIQGITMRAGGRHGLYASHAHGLTLLGCKGLSNAVSGALVAYTNNLYVEDWEGLDNEEQHGFYFSNHGASPTFKKIRGDRNGRTCLQLNADWRFAPLDGQTVITGAHISGVIAKNNGGPSMNLFGVHGAIIEDVQLLDGLGGGLNLSNDDQDKWPDYGSKGNSFHNIKITGKRGLSIRSYSTGNVFDNLDIQVTGGPCLEWDDTVRQWITIAGSGALQPGSGHKPYNYEGKEYRTWEEAVAAMQV